ncbi:MAG: 50S ribosomal protein L25 [Spirochaetales bacterium]|jgi:large subunit ribosomal protein L25|nr:50S ribosomal protein L25 [Spirochaetales bacterium]
MDQKTLSASARTELRKGPSGRLRRAGKIPAVIYGHSGTAPITVDAVEFRKKFKRISENTIINLHVDDKDYDVLVKDFQENILKGTITHIDFYEIERGKLLRTHIPIRTTGTPIGVREGGLLEVLMHEIEVECLPKDIPEHMEIDVESMDVGSSIHISDLDAPDGVKFLVADELVVLTVAVPKAVVIEEPEEELEEGELLEGEEGEVAEGEEGDEEETSEE